MVDDPEEQEEGRKFGCWLGEKIISILNDMDESRKVEGGIHSGDVVHALAHVMAHILVMQDGETTEMERATGQVLTDDERLKVLGDETKDLAGRMREIIREQEAKEHEARGGAPGSTRVQ